MTFADILIINAAVLTMDPTRRRASAVALRKDRILAVGATNDMMSFRGPDTRMIDAKGASVLPGFIESHMHLFLGGAELGCVNLSADADMEFATEQLRAYAADHPDAPVIVGQAMGYRLLAHGTPRLLLDSILADRPLALISDDHHTMWANTAALRAAGLLHGASLTDGHDVIMGDDNLATGTLLEPEAYGPLMQLAGRGRVSLGLETGREPMPAATAAERDLDKTLMQRGLDFTVSHGITSIVNMDGNRYTLELLDEIRTDGNLKARVRVPFHFLPDMDDSDLDIAATMDRRWNDDWLRSGFVKMFMDGVLESGTAFMKNDYPTKAGWRGSGRFSSERFAELATRIDRMGLQIAVHAIGDAAVARVIDGYEAAINSNGRNDMRHRIEHIELIDESDMPRLIDLGLIASMQPLHAPNNDATADDPALRQIPPARWRNAFAMRRLDKMGAKLAFASDWPVAPVSVLEGICAATTAEPWRQGDPKRRLGLHSALAAYTIGGAYAEHTESIKGSLSPGKLADVVILDQDIEAVAPEGIRNLAVRMTICGGAVTHEAI
jgi:predicted amidohydrolase YtcJ